MDFFGKKYKLASSENFDEFMKAVGAGMILRKAASAVTPTVELRKDGDYFVLTTSSTLKTVEIKFKPGEEFDEERLDGVKLKSVCTVEGNTLKHVQRAPDGTVVTHVREFGPDELKTYSVATRCHAKLCHAKLRHANNPVYPTPIDVSHQKNISFEANAEDPPRHNRGHQPRQSFTNEVYGDIISVTDIVTQTLLLPVVSICNDFLIGEHPMLTFSADRIAAFAKLDMFKGDMRCSGKSNPADCLSRGLMPEELFEQAFWFNGPHFTHKPINEWPVKRFDPISVPEPL
ncbi:Fatty acid-binding protein, muscle [Eumeta japonica]|uniref:Fatty acid-binding protein, muscle n=1 Tax=Eumeta variegata TaxID=151549 RepID=A0A4C1SEV9_EUMVA|nr:Fatty acid-binding protein, muscle [Eumeta japonica]